MPYENSQTMMSSDINHDDDIDTKIWEMNTLFFLEFKTTLEVFIWTWYKSGRQR